LPINSISIQDMKLVFKFYNSESQMIKNEFIDVFSFKKSFLSAKINCWSNS